MEYFDVPGVAGKSTRVSQNMSIATNTKERARPPKLLYVINHGPFFVSHRLPIAQAAHAAGWQVGVVTGTIGDVAQDKIAASQIAASGIIHHVLRLRPDGRNPVRELIGFLQLLFTILKTKPDIIHTASPKANLYGSLAARLLHVPRLVISISGMGYLYTGEARGFKKILRNLFRLLMHLGFRHAVKRIIVQNVDDLSEIAAAKLAQKHEIVLIPGSGVDLNDYPVPDFQQKEKQVVFPARLLKDKGVEEFVEAARLLKPRFPDWRFILAGGDYYANPSAISAEQLSNWVAEGVIEAWGHMSTMPQVFAKAAIACLPSYREGMPKALQEAAAAGCAVITTDTTGCREVILPGITGDLVPVKDSRTLAEAIAKLISNPAQRHAYGEAGRKLAEDRFSLSSIVAQHLAVYRSLWNNGES